MLAGGAYPDPFYAARREGAFLVAVNCTVAGGTCFCVSMETGPKAEAGFDLALTEVIETGEDGEGADGAPTRHYFVCEAGTERGAELLAELPRAEAGVAGAGRRRGRRRRAPPPTRAA